MNWKQRILALLGASYFMYSDSQTGFCAERAYKCNGYYWRKGYGKNSTGKQSWLPLRKDSMAKDLHTLIHAPHSSSVIDDKDIWTPLIRTMKAWYTMLESDPST